MINAILAALLGLIAEQEKERNKPEFIPIRTVAIAGGAHSPEAAESEPEPEPEDPGEALRADAVAYWKMDEASGDRADATGNGYTLTSTEVGSATGKVGDAGFLDANIELLTRLEHSYTDDLAPYNKDYYLFFWLYHEVMSTQGYVNIWNINDVEEFSIETGASEAPWKIGLSFGNTGSVTHSMEIFAETWYFIEMYYRLSDDSCGLAINNSSFQTDAPCDVSSPANSPFSIGAFFGDGTPFSGFPQFRIDEVGIMHRLPTTAEREYLYNSGSGRTLYP